MNFWQGKRIRLRGTEPSDAETFFQWNLDSDTGRNLDFLWPPLSRTLVQNQVEAMALEKMGTVNSSFRWILEDSSGQAVGSIDTHHCDSRSGTFSYAVNVLSEHQRKGYATEAIQLVLKYYFEELRYHKVNVQIHSYNHASVALHEKLGFLKEGTIRQVVYTHGKFFDLLWYGMTRCEWDNAPSRGL